MASLSRQPTANSPQPTEPEPLEGWVNTYYRYYKGKKLGPYYVRRWKVDGQVYKQYVKPADLERVRAACQLYHDLEDAMIEAIRSTNRFIKNFGFWMRMLVRIDRKEPLCFEHAYFFARLMREGFRITGRPSMRRKVTRQLAILGGQHVTIKTVHELDGTTKVFMVPFSAKKKFEPEKRHQVSFEQQFLDLYKAIFGTQHPIPNT